NRALIFSSMFVAALALPAAAQPRPLPAIPPMAVMPAMPVIPPMPAIPAMPAITGFPALPLLPSFESMRLLVSPEGAWARDDDRADDLYDRARDLIEQGKFDRAVADLDRLIGLKSNRTDAAMYWKAYSLSKLGQRAEALTALSDLI